MKWHRPVAGVLVIGALVVVWATVVMRAQSPRPAAMDPAVAGNARQMLEEGRRVFRYETFGDEAYWGDTLKLHRAIAGAKLGGVGPGVSPKTALSVGLKVDVDAVPAPVAAALKAGKVDLDDPASTIVLLKANAVVGIRGHFDAKGTLSATSSSTSNRSKPSGGIVSDTALQTIAQQTWLDPLAEPLSDAVHRAYEAAGETGRRLKNAAHGTWLGHPLHSALTDIPLGAWATSLVLDVADVSTGDRGYGRAADVAIGFGLAGAAGAAITGLTDWSETDGSAKRLGLTHALVNIAATALFATSLAARLNGGRASGRRLSVAGLLAVSAGAYIGGALVYGKRIGVTHADEGGAELFTPVLASHELTEGTKRKVDAGGTAVMVARQHGEACALAEHCSHLGGPLSEGTLKDGSVVCPWHGSEFGLDDGRVINGPATDPQPCFETRERNGSLEVRRR